MNQQIELLLEEGFGLIGMIQEIKMKSGLLLFSQRDPDYVEEALERMYGEITTYSDRLLEIEELCRIQVSLSGY